MTRSLIGSENSADHAWDFLSNWFCDMESAFQEWSQNPVDMNDNQILSTFHELTPTVPAAQPAPVLVFDACHIGVVLRAVLFVEVSLAVVCMYGATSLWDWVARVALVTGANRALGRHFAFSTKQGRCDRRVRHGH